MNPSDYKNPLYLEILAWALLLGMLLLPIFYYQILPDKIPSHFNAKGEADAFSSKASIWVLPIIGLGVFLLLHFLSTSKLSRVNYSKKLSPEEEAHQVLQGKKMLHVLKIIIPMSFLYINYQTIQIALGQSDGLGNGFLFVFLGLIFGTIAFYSFQKLEKE